MIELVFRFEFGEFGTGISARVAVSLLYYFNNKQCQNLYSNLELAVILVRPRPLRLQPVVRPDWIEGRIKMEGF